MAKRIAAVVGATGLVGRSLVDVLLADDAFERVIVLARRPLERSTDPRLDARVIDFDALGDELAIECTDAFCALGTTMKQAGSKEAFRRVDYDYVLGFAKAVRPSARTIGIVSSLGADAKSMFFYNRVKGETERDVAAMGFATCGIFRPSVLLGDRTVSRAGEKFGAAMASAASLLPFALTRRVRPIQGRDVARAMVTWAKRDEAGVTTLESDEIQRIANATS